MHREFDMDSFHEYGKRPFDILDVEDMVTKRAEKYRNMLNSGPVYNDRDEDITSQVDAMLRCYIEVKSYIERGKMGYTD
jgi:hypothetical protein